MKDRIPTPGQEGRMLITPENGDPPFYATVAMADNPLDDGTPLNAATLLKQQTASLFGLDADAVPNDAFAWLGKYNQHWWWRKATTSITAWREVQTLESNRHIASPDGTDRAITYSTKIKIDQNTGAVTLVNPQTFTVNHRGNQPPLPCYFTGLYDDPTSVFYFGKTDGTALFISSGEVGYSVWINPNSCYKITSESYQIPTGEVDYVHSPDRNAYPGSGESDGYEWQYLGVPFYNAVVAPKIQTGSYIGTGTYGKENPNTLSFNFRVKLILITGSWGDGYTQRYTAILNVEAGTYSGLDHIGNFAFSGTIVRNDDEVSWYNNYNAAGQGNVANSNYTYIAIG